MDRWKKACLKLPATIADAIRAIDSGGKQICLVVDDEDKLLGAITDGDIRRALLKSTPQDASATLVMNARPTTTRPDEDQQSRLKIMNELLLHQLPVVNEDHKVLDIVTRDMLSAVNRDRDNWVVLMAGGQGNRLRPLTEDTPKPLLRVGSQPILETILVAFIKTGFRKFYISVNYKAEMIQDYFGDGSDRGVEIRYLEEPEPLGTTGALGSIDEPGSAPLIVMNGDVLTQVNLQSLLEFHDYNKSKATMCVREYDFEIPYGVVKIEGHKITGIDEKPVKTFFVNAGIYVLEPDVLALIRKHEPLDMPDLFKRLIENNFSTTAFPIREYWVDIGRLDELSKATAEFDSIFD